MEKYVHFGVSDYEDDDYCTVSTEEIDLEGLQCDEDWSSEEFTEPTALRVLTELSQKKE